MKKHLVLIFAGILSSCGAPPDFVYRIFIENNSDRKIIYWVSENYPDTALPPQNPKYFIERHKSMPYDFPEKVESYIAKLPGQRIQFYFFDWDSVEKYGWDTIRARYDILERKDLSAANINDMGNKVKYP
ncbi:MAG: hypothetical protein KF744_02720 [Taibaiella sp.]|nr:hypothetical protein [Taibaiella sp.]